jgi:hypothetical protein
MEIYQNNIFLKFNFDISTSKQPKNTHKKNILKQKNINCFQKHDATTKINTTNILQAMTQSVFLALLFSFDLLLLLFLLNTNMRIKKISFLF